MARDTTTDDLPSGRFLLRLEQRLHADLRAAARAAGLSLNEYCARKLAGVGLADDTLASGASLVAHASATMGESLLAVALFGSWSRDELREDSDVDVLIVIDPCIPVTRQLYRAWDERGSIAWGPREVEPHVVHLPEVSSPISGLWAEVAVDGVVLFDRELELSRRLVEIRRRIVGGELIRRTSHGQPYWVRTA